MFFFYSTSFTQAHLMNMFLTLQMYSQTWCLIAISAEVPSHIYLHDNQGEK